MFLRESNDDGAVRRQIAEVDARIADLKLRLEPVASARDAQARLDLAGHYAWRGLYRPTLDLISPLDSPEFPFEIAADARQLIGDTHYRHDQYDLANTQYFKGLEAAREQGDPLRFARAHCGLAWVLIDVGHFSTGEFDQAYKIFEQHLPQFESHAVLSAMGQYGLSRAAAGRGRYDEAIDLAHRCLATLRAGNRTDLDQLPLLQLANVYRDGGDFVAAEPFYQRAVDAADRNQDPYIQGLTALSYGLLLRFLKRLDEACEIWMRALPTVRALEFPRLGHELCELIAGQSADREEYKQAYLHLRECLDFGNRVGVIPSALQNQQMLLRTQLDISAALEDELRYLTEGVQASIDGILVLEVPPEKIGRDDLVIHFCNSAGARMLGRRAEDIQHVLLKSFWKSPAADAMIERSMMVFRSGERCTVDPVQLAFSANDDHWYSAKIEKIRTGVAWTISGVTQREQLQREILAQRDRLEAANTRLTALDQEKSEMLRIAAHDLRSPIGNIRSLSELIIPRDEDDRELLATIQGVANSMIALIGNLLDVDRIERGEVSFARTTVDMCFMVRHVAGRFSADAQKKQIDIDLQLPDSPALALCDESAIRRVIQNLLSNALKFTPPNSKVWVRLSARPSTIDVEFADNGPGISSADRSKLFTKFARLSARPTAGESSTGLGLSIVKQLVEGMNGQIECVSGPGEGAKFRVSLPAKA